MQLKHFLAATAAFVAFSQPTVAYHVKRARSSPLLGSFPGQGPLPTVAQVQSTSSGNDSLPLENIQGDILVGMKKQKERFVFFHINDAAAFKSVLKTYAPANITSIATLISAPSAQPQAFVNVAFSHFGLSALGVNDDLGDSVFSGGQFLDAGNLNDDVSTWESAFKGTNIDGVFLIGSDQDSINAQYQDDLQAKLGNAWTVVFDLDSSVRPGDQAGHEHFGYLDGISNPAVTGFGGSQPGQAVVDPGIILTGRAGDPNTNRPSWALDGSFLVFRKLKQLVPEFHKWTLDNALQNQAGNLTVQEGALLLGSRMFGRWNSGAPIDLTPDVDDPALGADASRNNDFNYIHPGSDLQTDESRCPFTAHIRKTNPRDLEAQGLIGHINHAIRAGTPYGPEVSDAESSSNTTQTDRGLAFVEYQSVISNGFRFQQALWANNAGFPFNKTVPLGLDPVIGQALGLGDRVTAGLNELNTTESFSIPPFIISNGGEYFFTPSITALVETLAA
ncbi:peroxidase [Irpex rosettiformis]|uniref:Peroxidase n=1 Tax=Irpex rosettiformis TaxID=378272 RepID=A0ACB8U7K9_9APHY|nr:peroxidase [Irpex rosettiformis]